MGEAPATRASLLVRIRDAQDAQAWNQFVEIYAPLVYGFARRHGLQDADAADVTQEVLQSVSKAAHKLEYDPERGTFRSWLFTVVRNKVSTFLARRKPSERGSGGTDDLLSEQPARVEEESGFWDREYERQLFAWAAEQIRGAFQDSTWQAFWQTAVEGKSGKEVAQKLGMSVAAVYLSKGRVMTRLKEQLREVHLEPTHRGLT
jgi:RNA polymerase sigma-70 factor (ECF subfamily)